MVFLRTLLIIIVIIYVLRFLFRFLARRFLKKMSKNFDERKQTNNNNYKNEGDITVKYDPEKKKNKKIKDDDGEYVDYEEVKD